MKSGNGTKHTVLKLVIGLVHLFLIVTETEPYSERLEQIGLGGVNKLNKTYKF